MWWARLLNVISGLLAGGVAASTNSYESIATVTVGSGGSSTVTFSSIPSTYKHLQIRAMTMASAGATTNGITWINSDTTGTNYYTHNLTGNGSSAAAGAYNYPYTPFFGGGTSAPQGMVMDLLDYADTNKYKTLRILSGYDANGSGNISLTSQLWKNTAAITNVQFAVTSGNWAQYSSFALYGIKG